MYESTFHRSRSAFAARIIIPVYAMNRPGESTHLCAGGERNWPRNFRGTAVKPRLVSSIVETWRTPRGSFRRKNRRLRSRPECGAAHGGSVTASSSLSHDAFIGARCTGRQGYSPAAIQRPSGFRAARVASIRVIRCKTASRDSPAVELVSANRFERGLRS